MFVDGQKTLRLPPGDYSVTTYLDTMGESADRSGLAVLVDPEIQLHQSTDVVLDARDARLLETTAPQRTEDRQRAVDFHVVDNATGLEFRSGYSVPPMVDDIYVSPTASDLGRVLPPHHALAQGRADAEPGHPARATSASTSSPSRAARWAPGRITAGTVYAGNGAMSGLPQRPRAREDRRRLSTVPASPRSPGPSRRRRPARRR